VQISPKADFSRSSSINTGSIATYQMLWIVVRSPCGLPLVVAFNLIQSL
jgi:hypothetical protein